MLTWIENAGIAALWAAAVVRAPQAVRHREQRPLWFAVVMIALAMSMHLDPVTAVLARLVPGAHWVDLTTHLFSIVDAAAVLWFIHGAAGRHRHTRLLFGTAAAVMVSLVLLDVLGPAHARNRIAPSRDAPSVPDAYWWVFFAFHLTADTVCGIVCWSHGRHGTPRLLRYGLRLFGTGILLASVLWSLKLGYLYTRSPVFAPLFSPVTGAEAAFMALGVALPVFARIRTHLQYRRSYHGLERLWQDLTTHTPDVVLRPANRIGAAAVPLQLRLYRRVIEIRDAMIVLRNYIPPDTLESIRGSVDRQSLPEHLVDAHITASWLTAALRNKHAGRKPHAQTANLTGPTEQDADEPSARSLTHEIEHLLLVASAYHATTTASPRAGT
ncbi:MAB_1171c family putative transporter [Streptomyces sp. NPDC008001]|uniref:MAB_1171c family putative transporter n=1 Tax=Streptomyces sp. NPDC008001 TaxID=3364804 RepID=UPI0036EDF468